MSNLETIYKDIYQAPAWDDDGNPNIHPARTATAALTKGDACYFPSAASIALAIANEYVKGRSIAIINEDVSDGATSANYLRGGRWGSTRFSFTVGSFLWISASTAGLIVGNAPTSASVNHAVGIAETSTQFNFHPFMIYNEL